MISFLNGFILPALFAAAIPIILHFLSKKKARKIPFSSLKFLKIIENQRIKRVRLYQLLLIIARTLFIIFLVLAFSRPTISSFSGGSSNAQTTAVILLDDSYSMQSFAYSKTYFELAKEKILQLLESFTKDDFVFLYTNALEKPLSLNTDNVQEILSTLEAGNQSFNLAKSLVSADSVFRKFLNLNNELYIISDFKIQSQNYDSLTFSSINNFRAYKIDVAADIPFKNISIDTVIVENQLYELNKPFNIEVLLTNHDTENLETNLNLFNNNERVSMEFETLPGGQSQTITIKYIPKKTGLHFLKLQLEEDDLSFDNQWFFSFYMPDEIKTLFISDNTSNTMKTALGILSDNTVFKNSISRFNEWPGTSLFKFDLIVINDFKDLNENDINRLKGFLKSDHSIIIIPGNSASVTDYNRLFLSLINQPLFDILEDSKNQGYYSLENQKTANAIFNSLFRNKQSSFATPKVFKYFKQRNYQQGLVYLSNNDPFITQTHALVVFSASFDSDWSDMEINGLFVPLLYRTFFHAAQNKKPLSNMLKIGDNITFNVQGTTIDKNYFIQNPQGEKISVIPKPLNNNLVFDGGISRDQGFYILMDEDGPIESKAINHSSVELKKPFLDDSKLDFELYSLSTENYIEQIKNSRLGFELWIICILLAFLMLVAEMVLIKIIEGTPFLKKA